MGYARCSFTCLISFITSERAEVLYSVVSTYQQHLRSKTGFCERVHPHNPCHHDLSTDWFWLHVISMEQHCDAATETTSVLSTKLLQTARCQRRRAPTPLWGPGSIPNNWADFCGFLKPPDSDRYWRYARMVHSPSHAKLSACVQPIKAATMRHGSTWTSSIGAVPNHITKNQTDEFYSKSVLWHVPKGNRKRRISEVMSDHSLSS